MDRFGPIFPVGPVGILVEWIAPAENSLFYQFPVPTAKHQTQQSKMAARIFYMRILPGER